MAKPELGSKQKCQNCGTKFFDLNKDPIVCPKCGTVQTVSAMPSPVRATRAAAAAAPNRSTDDDEADTDGAEVMSLEDADQPEDGQVVAAETDDDADIETDDDTTSADDDDTFLEEEEDDDGNVSDLIDGDIENDEER